LAQAVRAESGGSRAKQKRHLKTDLTLYGTGGTKKKSVRRGEWSYWNGKPLIRQLSSRLRVGVLSTKEPGTRRKPGKKFAYQPHLAESQDFADREKKQLRKW